MIDLLQREITRGRAPLAIHFGGHYPQQRRAVVAGVLIGGGGAGFIGFPIAHGESVGDHARAGLHVEYLGLEFFIDGGQQEQRQHGRL